MINALREYVEDKDRILYDVDLAEEMTKNGRMFYQKLYARIGEIVFLVNSLERIIENNLLEIMNDRGEDERIWILIQDFTFEKKTSRLNEIYTTIIRHKSNNSKLLSRLKVEFANLHDTRVLRNLYIHSDWSNCLEKKYFVTKVKNVKKQEGYFRIRKKIEMADLDKFILELKRTRKSIEKLHDKVYTEFWKD